MRGKSASDTAVMDRTIGTTLRAYRLPLPAGMTVRVEATVVHRSRAYGTVMTGQRAWCRTP